MDIGRNDPCPCGSGRKYKKCCLNLQQKTAEPLPPAENELPSKERLDNEDEEIVTVGDVGDYGEPVLTKKLFAQIPTGEISAYTMLWNLSKQPEVLKKADGILGKILFRGKAEARKIKQINSAEGLVEIMLSNPDPLNHGLLLDRVLENSASCILLIIHELGKPQRGRFGELAIQAIYRSQFYPEDLLLELVTKPNATAYDLSLICMLLGMLEIEEATKPLWDYYHFFKKKFPHRSYWKGPLTGLADLKHRQDHPLELTQKQCDLVVQSLQQFGIQIESSIASQMVNLIYSRRILKLLQTLSGMIGDPGEDEQAQKESNENLMAAITSLLQTVKGFPSKQESKDEGQRENHMENKFQEFRIGDSVAVKPGTKDPDTGGSLNGWQGRITELEEYDGQPSVGIAWDSITLKNMPISMIKDCEEKGLSWQTMGLGVEDVLPATARDTEDDVEDAIEEIGKHSTWFSLGDEGECVQKVLDGIDPDDQMALVEAWETHLEKTLKFPFEAEVAEGEYRRHVRLGDRVKVTGICEADDHYGLLVSVLHNREPFVLPLCDLRVTEKRSANYQPVRDYVVWFANR